MLSPLKKTPSPRLSYGEDDMAAKIASFVAQQLGAGGGKMVLGTPTAS